MSLSIYEHTNTHTRRHTHTHTHTLGDTLEWMSTDEHVRLCIYSLTHTHTHTFEWVEGANEDEKSLKSSGKKQRDRTQGEGRVSASVGSDLYWINGLSSSLTRLNIHS